MSNKVWYSFASSAPAGNKVYLCHDDVHIYIYISCMGEFVWQNKTKAKATTKKKEKRRDEKKTAARTASHHKGTRAPEYSIINRWATLATYQTDFRSLIFRFRGNLEFCYNFFFLFFFYFIFYHLRPIHFPIHYRCGWLCAAVSSISMRARHPPEHMLEGIVGTSPITASHRRAFSICLDMTYKRARCTT